MNRVVIIGNAGGGKTTLSKRLAASKQLPLIFLDQVLWRPGWQALSVDEFLSEHKRLIEGEQWIMEGVAYDASFPARLERADTIVFLDFPLWHHYGWAAKRQFKCLFRQREDWVEGCPMLPKTLHLARIIWDIHKKTRPKLLAMIERLKPRKQVFHIRSKTQLNAFYRRHCPI